MYEIIYVFQCVSSVTVLLIYMIVHTSFVVLLFSVQ